MGSFVADHAWLAGDIVAGLSVWALKVPQALGYATISGAPVQYGLYVAAAALLVYPIFASSRHVITGPSSTTAAVTGAAVLMVATSGSTEAVQLVALITVLAGLMYVILALLKMGWISNFLSESVLTSRQKSKLHPHQPSVYPLIVCFIMRPSTTSSLPMG